MSDITEKNIKELGRPKFHIGEKVKIIEFGHLMWVNEDEGTKWVDMHPEIVGQEGMIEKVTCVQDDYYEYAISGIKGKHAWYIESQIESLQPNTIWLHHMYDWEIKEMIANFFSEENMAASKKDAEERYERMMAGIRNHPLVKEMFEREFKSLYHD